MPFILFGQHYLADPSRSAGGINPIWSYAHVPFGYTGDATEAVIDQIERFAPGFRDRIAAAVSKSTAELQTYNRNFIGGDIIGGANDDLQAVFRPPVAVDPPRPAPGCTGLPSSMTGFLLLVALRALGS